MCLTSLKLNPSKPSSLKLLNCNCRSNISATFAKYSGPHKQSLSQLVLFVLSNTLAISRLKSALVIVVPPSLITRLFGAVRQSAAAETSGCPYAVPFSHESKNHRSPPVNLLGTVCPVSGSTVVVLACSPKNAARSMLAQCLIPFDLDISLYAS